MNIRKLAALAAVVVGLVLFTGCKKEHVAEEAPPPDYGRPLPPGKSALRKITDPSQLPDLSHAYNARDQGLMTALDRSGEWFKKPSSARFFPFDGVTLEQAQASVAAFKEILRASASPEEFRARINQEFDTYISVGWNNNGVVLFTGYFSPVFNASREKTAEYQYPLYKRPADLVSDPLTGETKGRNVNGGIVSYPTRAEIERTGMLAGTELVWLASKLDAYIIQVNGSAQLRMTDGSIMQVGFAGTNGYDYTSIGKALIESGKIDKNRLSLSTLREYFKQHPDELDTYTAKNDRFVFFQEYAGDTWPAGSLGVKVEGWRSLATDKKIFPRGGVTMVQTKVPTSAGIKPGRKFDQFMVDQDSGGAIRAPGRADIYMGVGSTAELLAGYQYAEGQLYYFFLKPENVTKWKPGAPVSRWSDSVDAIDG